MEYGKPMKSTINMFEAFSLIFSFTYVRFKMLNRINMTTSKITPKDLDQNERVHFDVNRNNEKL